jgi:AcrR family transcriptional regulator
MAGDVEERILDAATAMFLQHGFGGASLERIAEAAGAGKATLYSRYSGKEALFSEVVRRNCEHSLGLVLAAPPAETLPERLIAVMQTIATRLLSDEVLGLIRLVVADAPRFPALASLTSEQGRVRSIEAMTKIIAEFSGRTLDARGRAAAIRHARPLATRILDAVISPMVMRALMGENRADLRKNIASHVRQTVALFVEAGTFDEFL